MFIQSPFIGINYNFLKGLQEQKYKMAQQEENSTTDNSSSASNLSQIPFNYFFQYSAKNSQNFPFPYKQQNENHSETKNNQSNKQSCAIQDESVDKYLNF